MKQHRLGRTDRTISAIGLGCATFGREIDEQTSFRILDHAVERGITFFDTAESYGGGNAKALSREHRVLGPPPVCSDELSSSELILGRWMRARGCHADVTVCTKVSTGNAPENIARAVRDSSQRLGVDRIDLFLLHSPDEQVSIEESLEALNIEVSSGRVGTIGCSNHSGVQLRKALDTSRRLGFARFEAIQNVYNMAQRESEENIFPICTEQEVSFISYSPLGAGFLTGKYTPDHDKLPPGTRFDVIPGHRDIYFTDEGFRVVDQLRARSKKLGLSMAYLAAAWASRSPHVACTLFGARTCEHVDNGIVALEAADRKDLFE